jgi:hypothetical protein
MAVLGQAISFAAARERQRLQYLFRLNQAD